MISKDDVAKLAALSLLSVGENELDKVASELDAVLGYVSDVSTLAADETERERPELRNVMREDVVTNKPGQYTDALVREFPDASEKSLRVKKIL